MMNEELQQEMVQPEKTVEAIPAMKRFKIFLIFYEIHSIENSNFLLENPILNIEYSILNYNGKYRIKPSNIDFNKGNLFNLSIIFSIGKITINKVRLYYFFSQS